MKPFWLVYVLIIASLMLVGFVHANTIGLSYDRALNDSNYGIYGDYETPVSIFDFEVEGAMQGGDAYLGNLDFALTYKFLRLESNNVLKGFSIDNLGRTNDVGVSGVFNLTEEVKVSAGFFGKNGNPLAPVYELENPNDRDSAVLKNSGLTIKEGSTLNLALRTEFDVSRFEVGVRGLLEVAGDPETEKAHQIILDIGTSGKLLGFDDINWTIQSQISAQIYGELIEYEQQIISGVEISF